MFMRRAIQAAIVGVLVLQGNARGNTNDSSRFLREYPKASRQLEAKFSQVRGTCRLIESDPVGSITREFGEVRYFIDHGYQKFEITSRSVNNPENCDQLTFVYCIGDGSYFSLVRSAQENPFIVDGLGLTPSNRSTFNTLLGRFLNAHYGIFDRPFSQFMRYPTFRLMRTAPVMEDGRSLVKVDYEIGTREPKDLGSIVFDPDEAWVIRSRELRPGAYPGSNERLEITYGGTIDGIPLPQRVTYSDRYGGLSICEFVEWRFESTPVDEFGLGHYGLPDIEQGSRNVVRYWIIGLSLGGVILATCIRLRIGWRSRPSSASLPQSHYRGT